MRAIECGPTLGRLLEGVSARACRSCHFRVVVAGARGGVLEVKVIELIPFTADRLNPHWSSSRRLAAAPAVNQEFFSA